MREGRVTAAGIELAYLEEGDGPLVLLLHGFPDNYRTFSHQMPALAAAGYRAVAVSMRGYPPSAVPAGGHFDAATLANDAAALIDALGPGPAFVVGHDWGALATFGLCAAFPERVRRAVAMAVPHPLAAPRMLGDYAQLRRSFYIWFFQMPAFPEAALAGGEMIERLWADWSPGHSDAEHLASVRETLSSPEALTSALGYYRAAFGAGPMNPALGEVAARVYGESRASVLLLWGANDGCIGPEFAEHSREFLPPPSRVEVLESCGHFLHRERPDEVNRLILDWLAAD